jgi:phosphohistidine phosphatase SixA
MRRRPLLVGLLAAHLAGAPRLAWAQPNEPLAQRLRAGACVLLLRHAQTVAGVGDPPGMRVDLCSTQRNLSEMGRAQARNIGQWFRDRDLRPRAVRSSAWCRCRDTADLAFGRHILWPALNSFFAQRAGQAAQTEQLRGALQHLAQGQFEVWVTHQVNATALTGEGLAMGEGLLLDTHGRIVTRSRWG